MAFVEEATELLGAARSTPRPFADRLGQRAPDPRAGPGLVDAKDRFSLAGLPAMEVDGRGH
jgi:hypothetical protein